MLGKYGGGIRLLKTSSQLTSLKNGCRFISSASSLPHPRRRLGSLVNSYARKKLALDPKPNTETYLLEYRNSIPGHGDWIKRFIFKDGIKYFVFVVSAER